MNRFAITNGRVITPENEYFPGYIIVENGLIIEIGEYRGDEYFAGIEIVKADGLLIVPGFIEVHLHGFGGIMIGSSQDSPIPNKNNLKDNLICVSKRLPETGITSYYPTLLVSTDFNSFLSVCEELSDIEPKDCVGSEICGFHVEGPFFNDSKPGKYDRYPPGGAIPPKFLREANCHDFDEMFIALKSKLKMLSISPEIPGAIEVIKRGKEKGVVMSGAHSFASYDQVLKSVEAGLSSVTHLYNGMRHQAHRDPGIIEASLCIDEIFAQIISDGIHVHKQAFEIAYRCKGKERLAIISDNTAWAGMPNGFYIDSQNRKLRKTDNLIEIVGGPLYGSVMPFNEQFITAYEMLNIPLNDLLFMATVTPAKLMGIFDRKGSLEKGKEADFLILNEGLKVIKTYRRGILVYES